MNQTALTRAIAPDRDQSVGQSANPQLCSTAFRPAHVSTEMAASMLLVEPATMLKSHSVHGHYINIRPVRLPNRKLAWPVAEIEKLFETHDRMPSAKEAA